jgi:hypothetical protein
MDSLFFSRHLAIHHKKKERPVMMGRAPLSAMMDGALTCFEPGEPPPKPTIFRAGMLGMHEPRVRRTWEAKPEGVLRYQEL